MTDSSHTPPQLPPEILRYLQGPPPESRQFDFLICDWEVTATRYKEDGSPLLHYHASWNAHLLNGGRLIMDNFKAYAPDGQEISSFVTLRTYAETTHRWEITGLAAHQPAAHAEWYGEWRNGEMHLDAIGKNPAGQSIHNKIRFYEIKENSFDWESNISRDAGKTWSKAASLHAKRVQRQEQRA